MAKMLNYSLLVSQFELQLHYYIPFQTNSPWEKILNFFILPAMG